MSRNEFEIWSVLSIKDYAEDLFKNHRYSRERAKTEASKSFKAALPEGADTKNKFFLTYEFEGSTAGYLWFSPDDKSAFLSDIMLLPDYQGKGMGKEFIRSFLNELNGQCLSEVELRVAPENERALKLYKDLGFRITGFNMVLLLDS